MDGDCGGDHDNDDNGDGAKRGVPAWLLSRATLPLGTHPFRVDGSKVSGEESASSNNCEFSNVSSKCLPKRMHNHITNFSRREPEILSFNLVLPDENENFIQISQ